ncbi:hypothetical protein RchiOBHm_Chr2g0172311 [Rosa chinensis]|uniref:Uncharacterized protein n=1 Tax=Rosa chinensis TaxID=74649 RepID=A0A2P6S5N3_ROSCH|nr:hypothetical protein RchiOBHm_Chr2g0172311 [Rosa chinensis]
MLEGNMQLMLACKHTNIERKKYWKTMTLLFISSHLQPAMKSNAYIYKGIVYKNKGI